MTIEVIVGAVLAAAFSIIAYFVRKVLHDLKALSMKQKDLIDCLIRGEDLNPAERRRELTMIGKRR